MKPSSRPPPIRPYWFHASPYPLDDPLAPLPIPASAPAVKQTYRPFSHVDSTALEEAFQNLPVQRHPRPTASVSSLRLLTKAPKEAVAVQLYDETGTIEPNGSLSGMNHGTAVNPSIRPRPFARLQTRRSTSPAGSQMSSPKTPPLPSPPLEIEQVEVPVGIQRLHKVLLPSLVMTPLYWSPLHHIASVVRGTWFYKDTLLPLKAEVANRLEAGWEEVRAWTEEWEMELASAVEVGWEGEKKVRWQLWDKQSLSAQNSRPGTGIEEGVRMPGVAGAPPVPVGGADAAPSECDWVLFANETDAYICRDSILSFGNKRPLANIRRGKTVGTHVIRGFRASEWGRLHLPKRKRKVNDPASAKSSTPSLAKLEPQAGEKRGDTGAARKSPMPESVSLGEERLGPGEEERREVTELFLVIHGIGQKLSERVESFRFTHAINSFRRHINVELQDPAVKPHLRDGGTIGMMVLPINWRHNLTFEDEAAGGPINRSSDFSLSDITPPTIPAVRNLIGDVMLDIPYYLSHHKQTMINAVVKEANRVYRLWCTNNPRFEKEGRVHIIAHSLGSVIAMDILSKQPTRLDAQLEGKREDMFDFDTKNVFFVGSPAGFFLLLNKCGLLPRKGRNKPGAAGEDLGDGVAGEAGTYGCLAIDNIYNVLHYSDPIAYRLNPTVDIEYDASLKTAYVPSSTPSLFSTLFRPFSSASAHAAVPISQIPAMPRLPSTIELQTHDFSREELAEKRMYLLNDNGQIDWYLSSGAGAMENQYLNILGAHSSYWESRDFVRFCVCEVGRSPGRNGGNGLAARKKARSGFG